MAKISLPTGPKRSPAVPVPSEPRLPARWIVLGMLVLSVVYFLPALVPGRAVYGSDYLTGGYFFYDFVAERLAGGALPKWVPYIYGGLPLFSNPGSTFHPVHFLAELVLPTLRVLPVIFIVQFWAAGVGAFLLSEELGCRRWVAALGGLSYQFTGVTLSWVYAGHDGRVMVATMAPLFLFFLHKGVRTVSVASFAGAAATLGLALLSFQIQTAYYLLLAGALWGAFCLFEWRAARSPGALARTAALGIASVAVAFLLAAVNFLPFLDYVPESPRGDPEGRGWEYATSYSLPPAELLGVAVPEQAGANVEDPETETARFPSYRGPNPQKLHTEYLGAFVLLLLGVGIWYGRTNRYWLFFAGLAAFALTLALGGHSPLYRVYYEVLPGIKRFRAPDLAYYVVALSLVMMAALTLERLATLREGSAEEAAAPDRLAVLRGIVAGLLGLVAVGAFASGVVQGLSLDGPSRSLGWWRFLGFALVVGAVLWVWSRARITSLVAGVLLAVTLLADQWVVGRRFFHTVVSPEVVFAADDVVAFLQAQPGPFRVWNIPGAPHRGRESDYLMYHRIEQAGGEHGNQLQRWNEYVGAGTDAYVDWDNFLRHTGFPAAANVRYFLANVELEYPGTRLVHSGSAFVYENTLALPRAYLVPRVTVVPEDETLSAMTAGGWEPKEVAFVSSPVEPALDETPLEGAVEVVTYDPDRVVVQSRANRRALLVLADNAYEGWEATIDGAATEILRANHTFRAVVVPEGAHVVEFVFRPGRLEVGLYVSLASALALAAYGLLLLRARGREPEPGRAG